MSESELKRSRPEVSMNYAWRLTGWPVARMSTSREFCTQKSSPKSSTRSDDRSQGPVRLAETLPNTSTEFCSR